MTDKKSYKASDIVISGTKEGGAKFEVSAQSFSLVSFAGCKVSGEKYYVDKAVKLGAEKTK